jgi:hypothetical protein
LPPGPAGVFTGRCRKTARQTRPRRVSPVPSRLPMAVSRGIAFPRSVVDLHVQYGQRVPGSVLMSGSWMPAAPAKGRAAGLCVARACSSGGAHAFRRRGRCPDGGSRRES